MLSRKKRYRDYDINPDDIFIDNVNVSELNMQQFEGVVEKPIHKRTIFIFSVFVFAIFVVFIGRMYSLQIVHGDEYAILAERNILRDEPLFSERGIIYDRNGVELAWNKKDDDQPDFLYRQYTDLPGIGHVLGYVKYPQTDDKGFYWRKEISGQAGLEQTYNDDLEGENGIRLIEVDALGNTMSENKVQNPESGTNIHTTIDAPLQSFMYESIANHAESSGFNAGAGIIMDVHTGELLVFTSYPEFDPYTLAEGDNADLIQSFFNDPRKPFLNRLTKGLYSPGSIIKPFLAIAALHEDLITKNTSILSTGRIEVPNRYNPDQPAIFRDWRPEGHGSSDIRFAIADSVNTFFYAIGGGYGTQEGLGIARIEEYISTFGIASPTGIKFAGEVSGTIPTPEWKERIFDDGTWRLGDTYNTSIGQFGFQVTPIQIARAIAGLANMGDLVRPILVKQEPDVTPIDIDIAYEDYKTVHDGMRDTVLRGTAQSLNVNYVDIALKTGTAQVGHNNEFYNSWAAGFFPYKDPQYSFVIVMERAPEDGTGSASQAMRTFINQVESEYPEFWDNL